MYIYAFSYMWYIYIRYVFSYMWYIYIYQMLLVLRTSWSPRKNPFKTTRRRRRIHKKHKTPFSIPNVPPPPPPPLHTIVYDFFVNTLEGGGRVRGLSSRGEWVNEGWWGFEFARGEGGAYCYETYEVWSKYEVITLSFTSPIYFVKKLCYEVYAKHTLQKQNMGWWLLLTHTISLSRALFLAHSLKPRCADAVDSIFLTKLN